MGKAHGRAYWNPSTGLPGKVTYDTIYVQVKEMPNGKVFVWWKGTGEDPRYAAKQWAEDAELGAGLRSKTLDRDLNWVLSHYGYESDTVKHAGFSRGGSPARFCGGVGYGSATFAAYPPREGSQKVQSETSQGGLYNHLNAWFHNEIVDPVSEFLTGVENFFGVHAKPYEGPHTDALPEHPMAPISERGRTLITIEDEKGNVIYASGTQVTTPMDVDSSSALQLGGKRKYDQISQDSVTPIARGGFSGLVSTFYNPVTSQIIGYKGIRRKRKFSSLHRFSPFWKEHDLTQTSVLVAPSQA